MERKKHWHGTRKLSVNGMQLVGNYHQNANANHIAKQESKEIVDVTGQVWGTFSGAILTKSALFTL